MRTARPINFAPKKDLLNTAIRANIRASADHLRHGSEIVESLIAKQGLLVVGAEYSLETGLVEFFDGMPPNLAEPASK